MTLLHRTALAVALLAAAPSVFAGTDSANLNVRLRVDNSCTIGTNLLNFGNTTSLATQIDAATTVNVTCTGISPLTLKFGLGNGAGATFGARKMTDAVSTQTVDYSLYTTATRTQVLGDGTGTTGVLTRTSTGGGVVETFDIYGRVAGGQGLKPAGTYSDTVVATVEF
jgi:spore coat protein U-like protein